MPAWYEIKAKFLYHFFSNDALYQQLLSIHDHVMFNNLILTEIFCEVFSGQSVVGRKGHIHTDR